MRGFSRLLPIPMRIDQTTMKFNTNDITLTNAHLHLGKSDFMLNGEINRIRQAMLRGGETAVTSHRHPIISIVTSVK